MKLDGVHQHYLEVIMLAMAVNLLTLSSRGLASGDRQQGAVRAEFEGEVARIRAAAQSRDLDQMEKIGEQIERDRERWKGEYYYRLMHAVSGAIGSRDFGQPQRESALERRYAELALAKPDPIPVDIEIELLLRLENDAGQRLALDARAAFRENRAHRWIKAWDHLEASIDETWQPDGRAELLNVPSPIGFPGVDARSISDPKLRAEYEAAVSKNVENAERNLEQCRLRDLDRLFSVRAEKYLIRAYSQTPFRLGQLKQLLDRHAPGKEKVARIQQRKARILDSVARAIQDQTSQPAVETRTGVNGIKSIKN